MRSGLRRPFSGHHQHGHKRFTGHTPGQAKKKGAVGPPGGGVMPSWGFPELLTHCCPKNSTAEADL